MIAGLALQIHPIQHLLIRPCAESSCASHPRRCKRPQKGLRDEVLHPPQLSRDVAQNGADIEEAMDRGNDVAGADCRVVDKSKAFAQAECTNYLMIPLAIFRRRESTSMLTSKAKFEVSSCMSTTSPCLATSRSLDHITFATACILGSSVSSVDMEYTLAKRFRRKECTFGSVTLKTYNTR